MFEPISDRVRTVIELDDLGAQPLDANAIYLWRRQLWTVAPPTGCMECIEADTPTTLVNAVDGGPSTFYCLRHGPLVEVMVTRRVTVTVAGIHGPEEVSTESILLPALAGSALHQSQGAAS